MKLTLIGCGLIIISSGLGLEPIDFALDGYCDLLLLPLELDRVNSFLVFVLGFFVFPNVETIL